METTLKFGKEAWKQRKDLEKKHGNNDRIWRRRMEATLKYGEEAWKQR